MTPTKPIDVAALLEEIARVLACSHRQYRSTCDPCRLTDRALGAARQVREGQAQAWCEGCKDHVMPTCPTCNDFVVSPGVLNASPEQSQQEPVAKAHKKCFDEFVGDLNCFICDEPDGTDMDLFASPPVQERRFPIVTRDGKLKYVEAEPVQKCGPCPDCQVVEGAPHMLDCPRAQPVQHSEGGDD